MNYQSLIAVDPSLTCSGWAYFSTLESRLLAIGKIKSLPPGTPLAWRLQDLQHKINRMFDQLKIINDAVLICESATTMRDPRAAFKVEQVRGLFEAVARERGIIVPGRINPRSVQSEVMGLKGKQLSRPVVKEVAVKIVQSVYGERLASFGFQVDDGHLKANQDIVDAILIGSLGLARIGQAHAAQMPLEELFEVSNRPRQRRMTVR
ncbi:MAG: hypothetical protein J5J00_03125 [Deltaproteobacteria bacterium]|nr:hypothetical protein [Deltaproteobacteria bacterium]